MANMLTIGHEANSAKLRWSEKHRKHDKDFQTRSNRSQRKLGGKHGSRQSPLYL